MADFGSPVAQNVDISPQKGLQTISSLLSLKSQQLGIQQQQQGLQGQAAQVQKEQLEAQQQQGVQNFFQQWDPSAHIGSDGTTDVDSALQSPAYQGAGNAKPGIMQSLLDIKNRQLTNKQSLATLNGQLLTQFSQGMGALAKDPDVVSDQSDPTTGVNAGRAKVDQFISNFSKLSPDAQRVAQIYGPVTQHAPQGKLSDGIQAIQMQGQDVGGQQAQQNPIPGSVNTGMQVIPTVTPKATGITRAANAPPIANLVPSPGERIPHLGSNSAGQTVAIDPLNPNRIAPAGSGAAPTYPGVPALPNGVHQTPGPPVASPLGSNPTTAQANLQNVAASATGAGDAERYTQISDAGTSAQRGISLADQVANLSDQVRTGKLTKEWADKLAVLQQHDPAVTARQMLSKYAAQLQTTAVAGAPTDNARQQIEQGMPNPETMDPEAIKQAAQFMRGNFRLNQARQAVADKYVSNNKGPVGIRDVDDQFMQHADPLVFSYSDLPAGPERQKFLAQHFGNGQIVTNPTGVKQLIANKRLVEHYGGQ